MIYYFSFYYTYITLDYMKHYYIIFTLNVYHFYTEYGFFTLLI